MSFSVISELSALSCLTCPMVGSTVIDETTCGSVSVSGSPTFLPARILKASIISETSSGRKLLVAIPSICADNGILPSSSGSMASIIESLMSLAVISELRRCIAET